MIRKYSVVNTQTSGVVVYYLYQVSGAVCNRVCYAFTQQSVCLHQHHHKHLSNELCTILRQL